MRVVSKNKTSLIKVLLEDPLLPQKVRSASTQELVSWIDDIGLEDCGEILAFADVKQIESVFDEDLWKSTTSGGEEFFQPERFGVWLEIMSEMGIALAADKIADMDEDFLAMAFSTVAFVIETDFLSEFCEVDRRIEKIIESKLVFEIDEYTLFGKVEHAWDAFISMITEMDSRHHVLLYRVLGRCAIAFQGDIESDDLFEVLRNEDQLVDDVAYEREKRREAKGYVTPSVARSFLKLAEEMDVEAADFVSPASLLKPLKLSFHDKLTEAGIVNKFGRFPRLSRIFEAHPQDHSNLMEQIGYLANVLMSGWDWLEQEPRAGRALEIVFEVCEEGLSRSTDDDSVNLLRAFRQGWKSWLARSSRN